MTDVAGGGGGGMTNSVWEKSHCAFPRQNVVIPA